MAEGAEGRAGRREGSRGELVMPSRARSGQCCSRREKSTMPNPRALCRSCFAGVLAWSRGLCSAARRVGLARLVCALPPSRPAGLGFGLRLPEPPLPPSALRLSPAMARAFDFRAAPPPAWESQVLRRPPVKTQITALASPARLLHDRVHCN